MNTVLLNYIARFLPQENILLEEPMYKHTTFKVGGNVKCFLEITQVDQLKKLVPYLVELGHPYFILGNGSNLLVGDKGYNGFVLHMGKEFSNITSEGQRLTVNAGALLSEIATYAMEKELTGMEFASGIPGTIGGSVVMNAGAYDGEMKQIVECVQVMDQNGNLLEMSNADMEFGYRTSVIKNRPFIVTQVVLNLKNGNRQDIWSKMDELTRRRKEKQPLEFGSAGSTFKRPEGHYAGQLIMNAGLRGYRIGGAQVSEKHCGFLINTGNATAADVMALILDVCEKVKEQSGVSLTPEVVSLGEF